MVIHTSLLGRWEEEERRGGGGGILIFFGGVSNVFSFLFLNF